MAKSIHRSDTNVDGRWAEESNWRQSASDLGLDTAEFPFAASFIDEPTIYLAQRNFLGLRLSYLVITPLNLGNPIANHLFLFGIESGVFPFGYDVAPDN